MPKYLASANRTRIFVTLLFSTAEKKQTKFKGKGIRRYSLILPFSHLIYLSSIPHYPIIF